MIPIVFATDHNFIIPTCVTILSLLSSSQNNFEINVIIDDNVTKEDEDLIRKQVISVRVDSKIKFIKIGNTFSDGFEIRGISKACYNRLMIPWLLPEYDKVIYSDVDIIFRGDISEIYDFDLEENLIAGVGGEVWDKGLVKKYLLRIGADPKNYINSGFLLINSKLQRDFKLKDKYLSLAKNKFIYQDQDIINLVCKNKIAHIPEVYNVKPSKVVNYADNEVKVIHFIGLKPWQHFTFCWLYWWNIYNKTILYDKFFIHNISSKILSPWSKVKVMRQLILGKFKLYVKLLGFF